MDIEKIKHFQDLKIFLIVGKKYTNKLNNRQCKQKQQDFLLALQSINISENKIETSILPLQISSTDCAVKLLKDKKFYP